MFNEKQTVYSNDFIKTVLSRNSAQYHFHLTILMQEYLNTGDKGHQMYDALLIFNKNPDIADKILSEMETLIDNPASITDKNNWQYDLIHILGVLNSHYTTTLNITKSLSAQRLSAKLLQHQTELKMKQDQQAAVENYIIEKKIQQQIALLRSSNIDAEIKQKLLMKTLPWEINPSYEKGPFRIGIEHIQTGMQEYTARAKIPLFDELSRDYPDLMTQACNNAERLPSQYVVKTKTIAWQQQLLQQDASLSLPIGVLNELLKTPPQLHSDLNDGNSAAPGYEVRQARYNETYVVIPLRVILLEKYPDLINAADQYKLPIPMRMPVHVEPQPIFFRSQNVNASTQIIEQTLGYHEITRLIGTNADIIDDIDLGSKKSRLTCPLTLLIMRDPVILGTTGRIFERAAIATALKKPGKSNINPLDNSHIHNTYLAPSYDKREEIEEFLKSDEFNRIVTNHRNSSRESCTIS